MVDQIHHSIFFAVIGMMVHVRFWFMFHDDVLDGEEREIRKKSGEKEMKNMEEENQEKNEREN